MQAIIIKKQRKCVLLSGREVLEVACGSGYWTEVIGEVAKSVLATDIDLSLISIAKSRCKHLSNVRFQIADAYTLNDVPSGFDAALGIWWWSHIPKKCVPIFLSALHSKLESKALVLFVDQLSYDGFVRRQDSDGNILEQRILPDGGSFTIVKNFPTKQDITDYLKNIAYDIRYTEYPDEMSWSVIYRKK
ncbi:MAG: class I SAM-dependent methyltransferase [Dehalococcoidales bacterium]|nr:class I SAM-dependent methyltransferase [Dehalococcoidales bacterium]